MLALIAEGRSNQAIAARSSSRRAASRSTSRRSSRSSTSNRTSPATGGCSQRSPTSNTAALGRRNQAAPRRSQERTDDHHHDPASRGHQRAPPGHRPTSGAARVIAILIAVLGAFVIIGAIISALVTTIVSHPSTRPRAPPTLRSRPTSRSTWPPRDPPLRQISSVTGRPGDRAQRTNSRSRARARDYRCGGDDGGCRSRRARSRCRSCRRRSSRAEHLLDRLDRLDRLDQAGPGQLVVVIAPPGVREKTTLFCSGLSSWVCRPGGAHRVEGPGPALRRPTTPRSSCTPPVSDSPRADRGPGRRDRRGAAGLRFAALALRSGDDPQGFIARFSGSEEAVAGYLTGEVMDGCPRRRVQLLRVAAGVMSAAGKRGEADTTSPVWSGRAHACRGQAASTRSMKTRKTISRTGTPGTSRINVGPPGSAAPRAAPSNRS